MQTVRLVLGPSGRKLLTCFSAEYAPDRAIPLVGGFIMLRLFNPSLLTPEAYGLLPLGLVPGPVARRNLTLVTKLLQNLSNNVQFGSKEQFMVPMNAFIDKNRDAMRRYLTELSRDPEATSSQNAFQDCIVRLFCATKAPVLFSRIFLHRVRPIRKLTRRS